MANLKNPQIYIPGGGVDLDAVLTALQSKISELQWNSKSFGRARMMRREYDTGGVRIEPHVYNGGGEYYPVLPNDALNAYSFLRVFTPRSVTEESGWQKSGLASVTIDAIFWVNLKAIDRTKDYIFTEELINAAFHVINVFPGVNITEIIDENFRDIYRGYDLRDSHMASLMYPYDAFRITFDLNYTIQCS